MLMLTGFMDETGHSQDEAQRFNGIAGLLAPSDHWVKFEDKWNRTLDEFKIPYFHMKDFEARDVGGSKSFYKGWSELKRRKLFGKLLRNMEVIHPLPIGVSIPMEEFRKFTEKERGHFGDPYFLCFLVILSYSTTFLDATGAAPSEKVALVFSDQVEFKYRALKLYDEALKIGSSIKRSANPPDFRAMRDLVPLQAADIVAYEIYKEHDRVLYRPHHKPRFGYERLAKMSARLGFNPMFDFFTKTKLIEYVELAGRTALHSESLEETKKRKDVS